MLVPMLRLEHHAQQVKAPCHSSGSSRILDIPCKVCGDYSSGKHYNIFACDGCAGFFKRSIRRNRSYLCKSKEGSMCVIDKAHRNQCRACRLQKCQDAGMNKDAVQHERGPRNSTIRKAMSTFFEHQQRAVMAFGSSSSDSGPGVLDLALPKASPAAQTMDTPMLTPLPLGHLPSAFGYMPRLPLVSFKTPPPMISPPITPPLAVMSPEDICEYAARLFFFNIQWAQNLPYFAHLPVADQLILFEEGWKELFVLAAAQFLPLMDLTALVEASEAFKKEDPTTFALRVREYQETLIYAKQTNMDPHEFSCLRVIALFKTNLGTATSDDTRRLIEERSVQVVANDAQLSLNKYLATTRPHDVQRFSKQFLLLSRIRAISAEAIEGMFFEKAVGKIPIAKIIADVYRNQQS